MRFDVKKEDISALGFTECFKPFVAELTKPGDLRRAPPGAGLAVASSSNIELLREAAKSNRILLLYNKGFQADIGLIRDAALKRKPFEIPVLPFLESEGIQRAALMGKARFFIKLCLKFGAPIVIVSHACDPISLKSPQEMIAIGEALGLERDQAKWAISEAAEMVLDVSR